MIERKIREEVATYARLLHEMRMVANHDGNVSIRAKNSQDRFICTPTAVSKRLIEDDDILSVDANGKKLSGTGRPFSELVLHLLVYQERNDVQAVIHAHPPYATAFGVSQETFSPAFLPEAVVSLGLEVPTVPLSAPGPDAAQALRPFLQRADAFLLSGNGVLAVGSDLEQAYLRLELVEHLCQISAAAKPLGGPKLLSKDLLKPLLAARKKAGLGTPTSNEIAAEILSSTSMPNPSSALKTLVTEEVIRALRDF